MAEKMFQCEYHPGEELVLRFKAPKGSGLPSEARSHARAAVKEGLLAMRSLFDAAISLIEQAEKPERKTRTKVEVE